MDENYKEHTHQATLKLKLSLKLPDECGPYNFGPYETELSQ